MVFCIISQLELLDRVKSARVVCDCFYLMIKWHQIFFSFLFLPFFFCFVDFFFVFCWIFCFTLRPAIGFTIICCTLLINSFCLLINRLIFCDCFILLHYFSLPFLFSFRLNNNYIIFLVYVVRTISIWPRGSFFCYLYSFHYLSFF